MGRGRHLFTSESVTEGHPDKIADQISDSILDAILAQDPVGRVACETLVTTGMAIIVRIATEAEARATRLAIDNRERVDVLETVNRIVGRFDGSQPARSVIQSVVDDIAREFQIPLVSMYLPDADGRLAVVGVTGYHQPFEVIETGVGIIGRAAATSRSSDRIHASASYSRSRVSSRTRRGATPREADADAVHRSARGSVTRLTGPGAACAAAPRSDTARWAPEERRARLLPFASRCVR
jgi:hypothetical protein